MISKIKDNQRTAASVLRRGRVVLVCRWRSDPLTGRLVAHDSEPGRRRQLGRPYGFYGRDKSLPDILDAPTRGSAPPPTIRSRKSISLVVSELYDKAAQFLELYQIKQLKKCSTASWDILSHGVAHLAAPIK
jgi:hypothetical protein